MRSAVYRGRVSHTRLRPFRHHFAYRVYYLYVDLDELDDLDRSVRGFSHGRFGLLSLADRDHGDGSGLRAWADGVLAQAGVSAERVALLAFPRVLGYVFDPISIWYAWQGEDLVAVIHEVHNTFGDRHAYVVRLDEGLRHGFDKELHVSPFMDMESRYEFAITVPGDRLTAGIRQHDGGGELFRASLRLARRPFATRTLLAMFFSHPLVTLKAVGAIHWQALRLWRKGATFHRRPEPRVPNVTVVGAAR
jgi:DUF1365 family protein